MVRVLMRTTPVSSPKKKLQKDKKRSDDSEGLGHYILLRLYVAVICEVLSLYFHFVVSLFCD